MASLNMYQAATVRVEDGELRWGQLGCRTCRGRGWRAVRDAQDDLCLFNCDECSKTETEEDIDRLSERIFLLTVFCQDEDKLADEPVFEVAEQ